MGGEAQPRKRQKVTKGTTTAPATTSTPASSGAVDGSTPPLTPKVEVGPTREEPTSLTVLLPTYNGLAVPQSQVTLMQVAGMVRKPYRLLVHEASSIPRGRQACLQRIRDGEEKGATQAWVLWLDNDIAVSDAQAVVDALHHAWETGSGWTANYSMANGVSNMCKSRSDPPFEHYTDQELADLEEWAPIPFCGFGFLYHRLDLSYMFHAGPLGEDYYYWSEHPNEYPGFAKNIHLGHKKLVTLHS